MSRAMTSAVGRRAGWLPLGLCLAVCLALVAGLLTGIPLSPTPLGHVALTSTPGGVSGFTAYQPDELWGGGNPAEHCISCTATSLLGMDKAQSVQPGQSVNPANGDFSTSVTLFSVPTAGGTFGVSLNYDAQRSIAEGIDPTAPNFAYAKPGPFGWGWQSSFNVSLYNSGHSVEIMQANGA